jgi:uncharacterized protein (TIGR03118 family)
MSLLSWLDLRNPSGRMRSRGRQRPTAPRFRPRLQALEDRCLLSGYQQTNLVGYEPGLAHFTAPNLNGWGMTSMPDGSFVVANAFSTGLATFYDRSGHVLPQTITVPASAAQPFGPVGHPTGVVYNPTSDFVISENGKSAPARLIFDSIDGTISGWNPAVDPTHAIRMVDTFAAGHPAVYTGLEMAQNSQRQNVLYATDIINNRVEMLVGSFHATPTYFTDPTATSVDAGFGAWSVQAVNGELFVTFANPFSPISGPHGGMVDVFNTDGTLLTRNHFAANAPGAGPLENPWGITQAPANFGAYSHDLLIGNVAGAGNINVYDPATYAYLGQLHQPDGTPIAITGLWDLEFGDGTPDSGKTNQLFFDAGPNAPGVSINGLFGVIRAAGEAPTDNASVSVPVNSNSVGLSSSPPNFGSQGIAAPSLMSSATTMVPASNPQAVDQRSDAFFQTVDAMLASRWSRREVVDPQPSTFTSMFDAGLFAQPMTTGDGGTAGTTGGTTSDGGSTGDSEGPFDLALPLTDLLKKIDETSGDIISNLK